LAATWRTSVALWSGASQVLPVAIRKAIVLSLIDRQSGDRRRCVVREPRGEVEAVSDDAQRDAGGFLGRQGIAVEFSSIAAAAGTGCAQERQEPPTSTDGRPHSIFYIGPVDADEEQTFLSRVARPPCDCQRLIVKPVGVCFGSLNQVVRCHRNR
jgi:hypothetical protein